MKKFITKGVACALALTLVGCGNTAETTEGQVEVKTDETVAETVTETKTETTSLSIVLRDGTYADVIEGCLPQFEEDNNCTVEVLRLSEDDLKSKIALDAMNSEGAYDLCMVDGSWMAEFTANGVLADLTQLGYTLDDDIIPATTAISYYNDDVYLVPYYGNVTVLMYNKDNVAAAGYTDVSDLSLEDIMTICSAAKESGKDGFVYRGDSHNNCVVDFMPILLSYGGWVVDDNNQPTVNTDEFKTALNKYLELIGTGEAMVKDDVIASIDNGNATMAIGWPGWCTSLTNGDYTAVTGKADASATAYNANVYGCWTLGITANSTKKDMTLKLLEYLMDPEVQLATVENGGVPCRYSCLQNEEVLAKYPQYEVVCAALESGVYRPVMEQWGDFYEILGTELDNIFNGIKTVDEGLDDAQSQLEALMN